MPDRKKAGPASPEVRRKALAARLAEREPSDFTPDPPNPQATTEDDGGLSVAGAVRNLKRRKARIDAAVDGE